MPVSSIRMDVDRATYVTWSGAMANMARPFSVPLVRVGPVPGLPQLPSRLSFTGLGLLTDVGMGATRQSALRKGGAGAEESV